MQKSQDYSKLVETEQENIEDLAVILYPVHFESTLDWFEIKENVKGCIFHPGYLTYNTEYIPCEMTELEWM